MIVFDTCCFTRTIIKRLPLRNDHLDIVLLKTKADNITPFTQNALSLMINLYFKHFLQIVELKVDASTRFCSVSYWLYLTQTEADS